MERFAGRTALVTGAAGGIGAATAYRLAEEGAAIAVVDVDVERCKSTVGNIEALGRAAKAFGCDVSDAAAVAQLRPCVERELGMVDVLVNNAGIIRDALLVDMTPASWSAVIDVNLTSLFYVCQAFLPGMQERGYGKIVNMSSRASLGNLGQT